MHTVTCMAYFGVIGLLKFGRFSAVANELHIFPFSHRFTRSYVAISINSRCWPTVSVLIADIYDLKPLSQQMTPRHTC